MFGLSESEFTAVKHQAKACTKAIKDEMQKGSKYDHVATGIIVKYHSEVSVLITKLKFIWLCGYCEGRWSTGLHED